MQKPKLSVETLVSSGFREVGCWTLRGQSDLSHTALLPARGGVYAFAIDGVAQYVGLASKSLRQRIGFYRKPGVSQRTNFRLNEIIRGQIDRGATVQILIGHPPDQEWNGLCIKGAEGLEAGLIAEFDLPWNMRGTTPNLQQQGSGSLKFQSRTKRSDIPQAILDIVKRRPGMTELEIAKAIYGPGAIQQRVNQHCRALLTQGLIERRGGGGVTDPYIYYPRG